MEMARVVLNQIPTTAVTANAAVTLTDNQPPFCLMRRGFRPLASSFSAFARAI
jgi:hypothetical protein